MKPLNISRNTRSQSKIPELVLIAKSTCNTTLDGGEVEQHDSPTKEVPAPHNDVADEQIQEVLQKQQFSLS